MKSIRCPACGAAIAIDGFLDREDVVFCEECDGEFVVESLRPLRLRPYFSGDDDYDDDYFTEDDE